MSLATLPPAVLPEQQLVHAVDALLDSPSVELAPLDALVRLGTVLVENERLTAVALDGVHDMEARELFALDGAGSTAGWLRQQRTGGDPRMRTLARRLAEHPVVRDAVVAGALSIESAGKVCTALAAVPAAVPEDLFAGVVHDGARTILTEMYGGSAKPADVAELARLCQCAVENTVPPAAARLEPVFVFLARKVPPAVLARTLRELTEALIPSRFDDDLDAHYDAEYLDLQQVLDGRWHVVGDLDPETGTALNAELNRRMATAPTTFTRIQGDAKRRAQALGSLARDGLAHDGAGSDRPQADISIVVTDHTLTDSPGALAARTADGARLRLDTVQRLGCDSRIAAVILNAYGQPLATSGLHRNATRRERRALQAQWGGCAIDGCQQPYARTRPHHVIPWWLSKITRLKDLAPLCDSHHHDIHEGSRTLRLRNGRHINPTGWTHGPSR